MKRVVIVASGESYRTGDFVAAARLLQVEPIVATDVGSPVGGGHIQIDLGDPAAASRRIAQFQPDAVVAVDDQGVAVAARAAADLGLVHNPPAAVAVTRNKLHMRRLLAASSVPQPRFAPVTSGAGPDVAASLGFPVVFKPTGFSAGRGVIRADDTGGARRAEARIRRMLPAVDEVLLAEEYLPGPELIVEGLLRDGTLEVLAIIDKPDPGAGPFFEETLLVTPSRHPAATTGAAVGHTAAAVRALGLRAGPIHAEVRVGRDGSMRVLEVAARSIGGLCGRALTFGLVGESLEVLVLRSALGLPILDASPARPATGVLMLPVPATGVYSGIEGLEAAAAVEGVDGINMTVTPGRRVVALPEGDRYLGFVFAGGLDAAAVEHSLREAAARLAVVVDGEAVPGPIL